MNAFEFGQLVGTGLEKQSNKYKTLTRLFAPAAQTAQTAAQRTARSAVPATVPRTGTAGAPKLTPQELAQMQALNAVGRGFSLSASQAATPVAARAMQQNAAAIAARKAQAVGGVRPVADLATRPGGTPKPIMPGVYTMSPQEMAAQSAMRARERAQAAIASGQTPNVANMGLSDKPFPSVRAAAKDYGRVPTGPTPAAQAQSFYDNATSGGRQRMIGIDPQGRGVPSAPQSWSQLSPAQQAAVQKFYSGGQ